MKKYKLIMVKDWKIDDESLRDYFERLHQMMMRLWMKKLFFLIINDERMTL